MLVLKLENYMLNYPKNMIIPAAGLGSRLEDLTKNIPKTMVKVNGKTILEHQLATIKSFNEITDLHIILGYKGDVLKKYINQLDLPVNIHFYNNKLYDVTGCSYSLQLALKEIDDDIIYHNSDLVVSRKAITELLSNNNKNVILTRNIDNKYKTVLQKVESDENNFVKRMALTLNGNYSLEAVGPAKLSSEFCQKLVAFYRRLPGAISRKMPCYSLFGSILKNTHLYSHQIKDDQWVEINNKFDLERASRMLPFTK